MHSDAEHLAFAHNDYQLEKKKEVTTVLALFRTSNNC